MNDYPGYPQYVIVAIPKSGTKTMNKVFSNLGFKVFDVTQMSNHAVEFNKFGREETEFAELAKIWEDNAYDVIVEPAGIYWTYMVEHWPKTKFIHLTRDAESWKNSFIPFVTTVFERKDSLVHVLTRNPFISPSHNEVVKMLDGYALNMIGMKSYFHDDSTFESGHPWPRFLTRRFRQFHADVILHAPKERTLFNYQVKDGWPKLRKFLEIESDGNDSFPHENKSSNAENFIAALWTASDHEQKYKAELAAYLNKFGITVKSDN